MGLNGLGMLPTCRLSGCPGTALTRRLANMPILHIVSLSAPVGLDLDTSTKLHEAEGVLRISLSLSPSISLLLSAAGSALPCICPHV